MPFTWKTTLPFTRKISPSLVPCAALALAAPLIAQTAPPAKAPDKPAAATSPAAEMDPKAYAMRHRDPNLDPLRTYHLQAGGGPNTGNEVLTGLRVMLDPSCKMYILPEENTILLRCTPDQLELGDRLVHEMDSVRQNYRLTYTLVESEGTRRLGVQHFALDIIPGVRTTLKNGSKIPVVTGSYNNSNATSQSQFTYLDIGLNFDVRLDPGAGGMRLTSKVEQSASTRDEDRTFSGVTEPVVRQTVLEGSATIVPGKPVALGSIDVAGSTRHLDIEVLLETVK